MSPPLDLSELVARARSAPRPGSIKSAMENKVDELFAHSALVRTLPDALGHLPTSILLGWGQSLTDDAGAGLGHYAPLLNMMRAELESRPDVEGVAANE